MKRWPRLTRRLKSNQQSSLSKRRSSSCHLHAILNTMKLASFVLLAACYVVVSLLPTCCASKTQLVSAPIDQHGSFAIQNVSWTEISQEDSEMIQHCFATEFQVSLEQDDSSDVEATVTYKNHVKTPHTMLRRGLSSYSWLFDFFLLFFNGCGDCLTHQIDDDMLFLRRLSTTTSMAEHICICLHSSGHSKFSNIHPNDCSLELSNEDI